MNEQETAHNTRTSRDTLATAGTEKSGETRMICRMVNVFHGEKRTIKDVNIDIMKHEVLAIIGPSGCGKSTFLRCLNRMNDTIDGCFDSFQNAIADSL